MWNWVRNRYVTIPRLWKFVGCCIQVKFFIISCKQNRLKFWTGKWIWRIKRVRETIVWSNSVNWKRAKLFFFWMGSTRVKKLQFLGPTLQNYRKIEDNHYRIIWSKTGILWGMTTWKLLLKQNILPSTHPLSATATSPISSPPGGALVFTSSSITKSIFKTPCGIQNTCFRTISKLLQNKFFICLLETIEWSMDVLILHTVYQQRIIVWARFCT